MLGVYGSAALVLLASLALGSALLRLLGRTSPSLLAAPLGFAALVIACPLLIRLPGRAVTLAILLAIAIVAAIAYVWRSSPRMDVRVPAAVVLIVLALGSLAFAFNGRNGVLGQGIYTNDQAAQLYWTDWLQQGVGPEPKPVRLGYPTGPQSVAAAAAETTNASLLDAFNGLLLAIPALTALGALAAMGGLSPGRRVVAASLTGLPYLAASFLAQSAFKETAMALLVLAFAVALGELGRRSGDEEGGPHPDRAMVVALVLLVVASVFVYSLPGLAWFAVALPIWLALELAAGGRRVNLGAIREAARRHRRAIAGVAIVVVVVGALSAAQLSGFVGKVGDVQASVGRLSSPVFPGEALGVWPEGDFRIVRGEITGAYPAVALGLLAAGIGAFGAVRRRDWSLVAMGASGVILYAGARLFASIYVEAKALAIIAPLVVLAALLTLFSPSARGRAWFALGVVVAIAYAGSTLLALRAAPVGFDQRANELQGLAGLIQGRSVAFLGVDRFSGYWLRGTLMRSPGGYVPSEVTARPRKVWQQGLAMDFDTLSAGRLDEFQYVITTRAGYQSTPPPNFKRVVGTASFVLWRRQGPTTPIGIIDVDGTPGALLDCATGEGRRVVSRGDEATVLPEPVRSGIHAWSHGSPFDAPGAASQELPLGEGRWDLSLQYHSQVPLTISAAGRRVELPPSLDGMYLTHQGQGSFWPAGTIRAPGGGPVTVRVTAAEPTRLQRLLGVRRQVWLGPLAATRPGATQVPIGRACGRFVDHYTFRDGGGDGNR
jgi:hypothetical protein